VTHASTTARIRVEVESGSSAERVLDEWMRTWRRRGARRSGKILHPYQGATKAMTFDAPPEAIGDLERRLHGSLSGKVTRERT
jgi:hypothetical protein